MPTQPDPLPPPPQGQTKDAAVARAGRWGTATEIARRVGIVIAVLLVTGLLALSDTVHGKIVAGLALAEPVIAQHPVLGALIFMGLAALSAMLVFFSGVLLVPIGVQAWGEIGCFLLLWSGWCLGGLVTYSIGRRLKRPAVQRMLSGGMVDRYESRVPEGGSFATVVLVQLAVPSDVSGYFFGLVGYPLRVYLGALMLTEIPYALGTVFLGSAFIQKQYVLLLSACGVALVALGLAWLRWRHQRASA
ncbi:MAG: VTT domain-containing protein [Gammaproteobacteria bacterium]|uniref:TVP38/TMEM64 family protein n=1 Tax=Rhodoferax sp. TaxID=50421 RepID=UPI0017EC6599|nr:VTT domain-containing protein [Rhodoferax sp.]MBU3897881.1 VTT domain-containing protein [Gammaproteobacteria bacterium]MBA3057772.1 TVP38/TMEM64 family protein [Rhodoferax sp.]MBU3998883.1 VTT domain-containing protein [Gammaproteobacteria bacterium]MBU4019452.1 VTT domain-containing protein [Gammaproteobacteria bacterium]MBU4170664.1 VTT domain-containing protein [Gammaproteobacteria bacterium]